MPPVVLPYFNAMIAVEPNDTIWTKKPSDIPDRNVQLVTVLMKLETYRCGMAQMNVRSGMEIAMDMGNVTVVDGGCPMYASNEKKTTICVTNPVATEHNAVQLQILIGTSPTSPPSRVLTLTTTS